MFTVVPDYYKDFKCTADKCKHSCCKGWEIDVDEDSLKRWANVNGEIGDRIREKTYIEEDGTAHFILDEEERCPFLNEKGLCDMIIALGEDSLCQICKDHPRFRNYWSDRTEIGLGMACEEAARIILSKKAPVKFLIIEDDGEMDSLSPDEEDLLELRNDLLKLLQDRSMSVDERIIKMLNFCCIEIPSGFVFKETIDGFAEEQLAVYLLYRNFADVLYDGRLKDRVLFVADSYRKIKNLWAEKGYVDIEAARDFSQRTEYDTDTWGFE